MTAADTVFRFPSDETLKGTYTQFLLGPSLLITPVLIPNVDTVKGVFPGESTHQARILREVSHKFPS